MQKDKKINELRVREHYECWLARRLQKKKRLRDKGKETMMGWTISVGTAGARGSKTRNGRPQMVSVSFDAHGVSARVTADPDAAGFASDGAGSVPAWQARRVWQNVLTTLVGT
jgi:hypothetical protein